MSNHNVKLAVIGHKKTNNYSAMVNGSSKPLNQKNHNHNQLKPLVNEDAETSFMDASAELLAEIESMNIMDKYEGGDDGDGGVP